MASNITTISIIPTTITPVSLQAAVYTYEYNPYGLRDAGCILSNGVERNCSQACSDINLLFSSGSTFENCLSYPSISKLLGSTNAPASEPAIEVYGIIPNDTAGSQAIVSKVNACFKGWANTIPDCAATDGQCNGNNYGACSTFFAESAATGIFPIGSDNSSYPAFDCINSICNYVAANAQVSADIGGIGIYISYIMQISIIFLLWLIIEYFRFLHPFITRRLQSHNHTITKIHTTTQKEMFIESSIEFHRAQCYFMATILVAALVATETGGLSATSLQQVFNNLVLLAVLSIGGSLPIMVMLFKLRLAGHRSWYTFALSSVTLALAAGLGLSSGKHKTLALDLLDPPSLNIPDCGTINPVALCLSGFGAWAPGAGTTEGSTDALYTKNKAESIVSMVVSLVIWLGLFLDLLRKLDFDRLTSVVGNENQRANSVIDSVENKQQRLDARLHSFWGRVVFGVCDFIISIGSLYLLAQYLRDITQFGYGGSQWTFGQITAVVIWVPPFVQYAYLQFNGVEGHRWSLPRSLIVTRKESTETEDMQPTRLRDGDSRSRSRPGRSRGRGRDKNSVDLGELGLSGASLDRSQTRDQNLKRGRQNKSGAVSEQRRASRMSERSVSRAGHGRVTETLLE